jgi:hypothetical protein
LKLRVKTGRREEKGKVEEEKRGKIKEGEQS